ncbi:MAG: hypothetical protein AAF846_12090 [Chloroflexota bacterium]
MVQQFKRYTLITLALIMTLALTIGTAFGQEEAEAVESTGSDGLMIAIIGLGIFIVFGLGAAMSSQAGDE